MTTKEFKDIYGVTKEETLEALSTITTNVIDKMNNLRVGDDGIVCDGDNVFLLNKILESNDDFNKKIIKKFSSTIDFLRHVSVILMTKDMGFVKRERHITVDRDKHLISLGFFLQSIACSRTINVTTQMKTSIRELESSDYKTEWYIKFDLEFGEHSKSTCASTYIRELESLVAESLLYITNIIREYIVEEDKKMNNYKENNTRKPHRSTPQGYNEGPMGPSTSEYQSQQRGYNQGNHPNNHPSQRLQQQQHSSPDLYLHHGYPFPMPPQPYGNQSSNVGFITYDRQYNPYPSPQGLNFGNSTPGIYQPFNTPNTNVNTTPPGDGMLNPHDHPGNNTHAPEDQNTKMKRTLVLEQITDTHLENTDSDSLVTSKVKLNNKTYLVVSDKREVV